ncbi:hypothetical protein H4582DRAFT_1946385 [Lactarius indigo]|nr:hypothetical protein H4582DRAFT_1946385 [Lactarius indigo]
MAHHHAVFHLKREESPQVSLGTEDNVVNTRSVSRPASPCSSATLQRGCSKLLEEQLAELERKIERLQGDFGALLTYHRSLSQTIVRFIHSKETREGTSVHAKDVDTRVLERRLEPQQLCEEAGALPQKEELARKAAWDQAQRKRKADFPCVFTGPLSKRRRMQDLKDIANALSLRERGKKADIVERIKKEFEANPELKSDPRFEGLFNPHHQKQPRIDDVSVAGPST